MLHVNTSRIEPEQKHKLTRNKQTHAYILLFAFPNHNLRYKRLMELLAFVLQWRNFLLEPEKITAWDESCGSRDPSLSLFCLQKSG